MPDQAHASRDETSRNIQANLLKASKFQVGKEKLPQNWSLFFFFRILRQAEFDAMMDRMQSAMKDDPNAKHELWQDFAQTTYVNAGIVEQRKEKDPGLPGSEPDRPADAFLKWLKAIVSADKSGIKSTADSMVNLSPSAPPQSQAAGPTKESRTLKPNVPWLDPISWMSQRFEIRALDVGFLQDLVRVYTGPDDYAAQLDLVRDKVNASVPEGLHALRDGEGDAPDDEARPELGPLPLVALYEILRQCAPAMMNPTDAGEPSPGIVRGEDAGDPKAPVSDKTPINIAFTYSGLDALKLNPTTLRSFPEAFKQGMAARAERLHDTGPSAPDFWEGELGLPSVHGYFTGGFALSKDNAAKESFWKAMRRDVKAFNDPVNDHGRKLRFGFRILFRLFGLEILHIELGQYPYEVDKDGAVKELDYRFEHFGFRDGLSQPFVDMGLRDTLPGGGTPSRDRTWRPVAPGEIFLNMPDENGEVQALPIGKDLTLGSTFLVFRKLQQDVAGFRGFLSRMRPKDKEAQKALSAQFVGRWPNGVPLVRSPDQERAVDQEMEATLNNFRYAADDPLGIRCPLGAHIRRANPRDIGGRGEARHHRILRRGISYGGPLLKDDVLDDGERRGLLFIAANSRIDLQFEVIQSNWINGGEFLGQAGLGRCPLTGNHSGAVSDRFFGAGAAAPMTGLPRFVITRGGDYFFAPGIKALREIANKGRFDPVKKEIPFAGFSMGDAKMLGLFDPDRLQRYGQTILQDDKNTVIRVKLPSATTKSSPDDGNKVGPLCFVGRYKDVKTVFRNVNDSDQLAFSVRQYAVTGRDITRGSDVVIGTEDVGPSKSTRDRLHKILYWAWETLGRAHDPNRTADVVLAEVVADIARSASDDALRRTAYGRRIDLVSDLAAPAAYGVIAGLYGVPAPAWLTELAASLRFAHQHVGELPPEWITKLIDKQPDQPGLTTLQIWSAIVLADLIGNVQSIGALHVLARQAGSEMIDYIDTILSTARTSPANSPIRSPNTLLGAFIENEGRAEALYHGGISSSCNGGDWRHLYYREVSTLLFEIIGTTMASVPLAFAAVMGALLKFRLDLPTLMQMPDADVSRIIYEADRLNPFLPVRMRYCETDTALPSGAKIEKGEWVAALIRAANLDKDGFEQPHRFLLDPKIRPIENYLLFNERGNPRECWGRDRVAMVTMRECVTAASRLQGLRKVAGPGGEPLKIAGITISLPARFTQVDGKPPPPQTTVRDMSQATTSD
jgi:Dyp-type peroxidase family